MAVKIHGLGFRVHIGEHRLEGGGGLGSFVIEHYSHHKVLSLQSGVRAQGRGFGVSELGFRDPGFGFSVLASSPDQD